KLPSDRSALPVFSSVTPWGALISPATTSPKPRAVGATTRLPSRPLPDRATLVVLLGASVVKLRKPSWDPAAAGANVTLTMQVADGARVAPQDLAATPNRPLSMAKLPRDS